MKLSYEINGFPRRVCEFNIKNCYIHIICIDGNIYSSSFIVRFALCS